VNVNPDISQAQVQRFTLLRQIIMKEFINNLSRHTHYYFQLLFNRLIFPVLLQ